MGYYCHLPIIPPTLYIFQLQYWPVWILFSEIRDGLTEGLGLHNMNQMTKSLQGEIMIESVLSQGTVIEVILPNICKKGEKAQ